MFPIILCALLLEKAESRSPAVARSAVARYHRNYPLPLPLLASPSPVLASLYSRAKAGDGAWSRRKSPPLQTSMKAGEAVYLDIMSILHDSVEKEGKKKQDGDPDPNQNRQSVSKTAPKSTISSRQFPPRPNAEIPTFEFKNKFPSKSNSDAPPPPTHPASSPGSRRPRNYRSPSPPAAEFSSVARTSTPRPQTPAIGMRSPSRSLRTAEGKGKGPHFDSKQPQAQAQAQPQFQPASRDRYSGLAAGDSSVASRERSGKSVYAAWKVFKGKVVMRFSFLFIVRDCEFVHMQI